MFGQKFFLAPSALASASFYVLRGHAFTLAALTARTETLAAAAMPAMPCRRLSFKEPVAGNGAILSRTRGGVSAA